MAANPTTGRAARPLYRMGEYAAALEDPAGPIHWDSFLADDFVPHLRSICNVSDSNVIAGISGGGYGALKLAFWHPHLFAAVAAMQPMLEPGFIGLRTPFLRMITRLCCPAASQRDRR